MSNRSLLYSLATAAFVLFIVTACGQKEIKSKWVNSDFDISKPDSTWRSTSEYFEDYKLLASFRNDDNYLYVYLTSTDNSLRRELLLRGMTIWFDPSGGTDKKMGIKFPVGVDPTQMRLAMRSPDEETRSHGDRTEFNDRIKETLNQIELLNDGGETKLRTTVTGGDHGISARLDDEDGSLVYKLKVPLKKFTANTFYVDTQPDKPLGIELESNQVDLKEMREKSGDKSGEGRGRGGVGIGGGEPGEGGEGDYPGGGGFPGGGMHRMGGMRGSNGPTEFDMWIKLDMAEKK